MASVSIIIPTLNESKVLARTLRQLTILDPPAKEVIVVDGGSDDDTVAIAQKYSATILTTQHARRSTQMNLGAQQASGDILCFLHGDTIVPDDVVDVILATLSDSTVACGGFVSLMTGRMTTRWSTSLHNSLKTYYAPLLFRPRLFLTKGLRLLFGDQVMFCRRTDFLACGGFDSALEIMEEADLCIKLAQRGRIKQVNRTVQSSDRRVAKWGPIKANLIYLAIGMLWGVGVSTTTLKRFYENVR
ncbi:TIGR04283 family arsenosugar biosynthesis glycosyltransferase [cf. Phormidesmis sp. LEGE 11477]|uniref:TIGR04283 family arsenosugar biosynthesis glycosyltransferase n=1 Tax=cf. Phormidesmis sp. LEGE 11477 TaxID=1828680 RepID=UPI00187FD6D2|nr:TIGR04283 family arsenosugar biosynthesis glycosyltransferase [cf. Phormidesmis sp. LEGE 11477]MBE9063924.1 TIGR04283 family arsenosugar biosynthesis glycosyltransferase [cf. Phormidesmis sp. LEGE 11477]